ncbi:hypothetical protein [Bifidobacterium eulemuris]|uniref:Uncharacterized protein n=1 Tax=Bifidobacterium eulemuris TaxID=1765219 RepID=A0A7L9SMB8_9BIFI|nr:hypothetical protein [Bifidobacterium eulemuris]QOL31079.1 hypothetical protein BE0216_00300 [Bifidobacterium eulemuris]
MAAFYGPTGVRTLTYGADKEFTDREPLDSQYARYRLTAEQIVDDIDKLL